MKGLVSLGAACAVLVPLLQLEADRRLGSFRAQEEILYVWSGEHLRRMFPGFESVLADVYWLRTVQYFGGQRVFATNKRFDLLAPLTEITVSLDPQFAMAYAYGATFLAEPHVGAGQPAAAVALLERGVRENPDAWSLWQFLGIFKAHFLQDSHGASESLMAGARRPGAPVWLKPLAALVLRRQGDRGAARAIWQSIYDQSDEGPIKENALTHLKRFNALDVADRLTEVAARFRRSRGRNAADWRELVAAGLLRGRPVDETGVPFDYAPQTGVFTVSARSVLFYVG